VSDEIRLSYVVGRLDRVLRRRLTRMLAPFGLSVPQYTALSVLQRRGSLSNAQLARRSLVTPQSMNEVVVALEQRGLIRRDPDPRDLRRAGTELTDEGRRVLAACDAELTRLEDEMLDGIAPADRRRLLSELEGCVQRLGGGLGGP
jgi:DNA-binding MarR family transcriptional regulator